METNIPSYPGMPISLIAVKDVLVGAAAIVNRIYHSGTNVVRKDDGSPLTQADTETNEFLKSSLLDLLPEAGWLSEENSDNTDRLARDWAWVVDPMDGTKEFARGIPEFAVSVGLVFRNKAVMGGIINPASGEGGLGEIGGQIEFWGGLKQKPSAENLPACCAILSRTEQEDGSITPLIDLVGHAYPVGSVAYKLLRVASGHDHMTISVQHKSEWDICGGVALLETAGKEYRRFDQQSLRFNTEDTRIRCGAVAGDKTIVEQFMTALVDQPELAEWHQLA